MLQNNVIGCFTRLHQVLVSCGYDEDDMGLIGCPTAEQVALILSSASLANQGEQRVRRTSEQPGRLDIEHQGDQRTRKLSEQPMMVGLYLKNGDENKEASLTEAPNAQNKKLNLKDSQLDKESCETNEENAAISLENECTQTTSHGTNK